MTDPVISVVMAAYNGTDLIGATIDSLFAQTYPHWELVVVDDCSTDDTYDLLQSYADPRIRAFRAERNGGPVIARNLGFRQARGRYIAGLDHDDLCRPTRFEKQVAYLDRHPETALLATAATELHEDGRIVASQLPPVTTPALIGWLLHVQNPLVWSSVMFRADAARSFPEMTDPSLLYAEDFDLYHRLSTLGTIARLDEELMVYRAHEGGLSKRYVEAMTDSAAKILARSYGAVFGDGADAAITLVTDHIMKRLPVRDGDTLRRLGDTLATLQEHYLTRVGPKADDRALIRWETARIWGRCGQAALRSGAVGIASAIANRPDHLGLGYAGIDTLMAGRLIGGLRNFRKRPRAS